jgi:hypothetical protein
MRDEHDEQGEGTLPLAERGFRAACDRLYTTGAAAGLEDAFVSLAEVLWWAVSLDEGYQARDGAYYSCRRGTDPDGWLWHGVRFARNRAGHQRLVMVRRRPGAELGVLTLGVSRLGTVTELVWRPAVELSTDPRHPDREGRRVYEQGLQGRPVCETIHALRRWFDKAAGRTP